jgi:hypothetical protein
MMFSQIPHNRVILARLASDPIANGQSQIANSKWQMEDGGWQMAGEWQMTDSGVVALAARAE